MKERKSGNRIERLMNICEKNDILFDLNQPSTELIIVDKNNKKHKVDKDFNLFNSKYNQFYENITLTQSYKKTSESESNYMLQKELNYGSNNTHAKKVPLNYGPDANACIDPLNTAA